MALLPGQWQIRDLVLGQGTPYTVVMDTNPFDRRVRAEQSGPRAWNHGNWSGAEWQEEAVIPIRITIDVSTGPFGLSGEAATDAWLDAHQALVAAFAAVGDAVQDVELRFRYGSREFVMFGRPRMVESNLRLIHSGRSVTNAAFVALDPFVYSADLHCTDPIGLPLQDSGFAVPGRVLTTPPYGMLLDGTGDYASTPDDASLDITGDIWLAAEARLADWTSAVTLVSKYDGASDERSYRIGITASGEIQMATSEDGLGTDVLEVSTEPVPAADGEHLAVGAHLDVDDGSGGYVVTFYTAPSLSGPWMQLGDPVDNSGGGTTSIFAGNALLTVGAGNDDGSAGPVTGTVHAAEVRSGDREGTVVAGPRFDRAPNGSSSFDDAFGKTWTMNGDAEVVSRIEAGGLTIDPLVIPGVVIDGTAEIINAGTADTGLLIRIDGPVEDPSVILRRGDGIVQTMDLKLELSDGRFVQIDTNARTAFLDNVETASVRGSVEGQFPIISPGTNEIRFQADQYNDEATMTVCWRDAWF